MLNGDGSENGNKINRSNQQKKTNYLHVQHTLWYISLPLFFYKYNADNAVLHD